MNAPAVSQRTGAAADSGLGTARRVLDLEARGLTALARDLGAAFLAALDVLGAVTGRIVVTGMGKSGHVARKIAATLASTGSPALYVHPAEASHGDLGMITRGDAILALSNSGETPEFADLVAYAKRFHIPFIAITRNAASTLGRTASVVLELPDVAEGCPMGLAPTTSTAVMLGLGDALAVALLERKGFSTDDFRALHPGGKLGRRLLKVADIMHGGDEVPLVRPEAPMAEVLVVMTGKSFGCVGITDADGRLIGVITDGDLRRHMSPGLVAMPAEKVMTRGSKTVRPGVLASEALYLMNTHKITNLFVVEDGIPIGVLHVHDCLRAGVA